MDDDRLLVEEKRRAAQHNALKAGVEAKVDSVIESQATAGLTAEEPRIESVASQIRRKAIEEVAETEREVGGMRAMARVGQFVDYAFYLVYALLGLRFLLALMAAREVGFVRFIKSITDPLYAPFKGIVASAPIEGGSIIVFPLIVAVGVYLLAHLGIKGLLRLIARRRTEI